MSLSESWEVQLKYVIPILQRIENHLQKLFYLFTIVFSFIGDELNVWDTGQKVQGQSILSSQRMRSSEKPSPAELWLTSTYPSLAASWRGACLRAGGAKQHGQVKIFTQIWKLLHFYLISGDITARCGLAQAIRGPRPPWDGWGDDHLLGLQDAGAHWAPLRSLHVRGGQAVPQENFPQGLQVRCLLQRSVCS